MRGLLFSIAVVATSVPPTALSAISTQVGAPPVLTDFGPLATLQDVQLSPSGDKLLIVRKASDGKYEVEVRQIAALAAGGLSFGAQPAEVREATWLSNDRILVSLRERVERSMGSGFWGDFHAVFDDRGQLKYRLPGQETQILSLDTAARGSIYVAYDSTGDGSADVHRVEVQTGREQRILRGNNRRFGFAVDRSGEVRLSATFDPSKFEVTHWVRAKTGEDWTELARISPSERRTFQPVGFLTEHPDELAVVGSFDQSTDGLHIFNVVQRRVTRTLFRHPDVDVEDVVLSHDGKLLGARYSTDRPRIEWFDPLRKAVAKQVEAALPNRLILVGARGSTGVAVIRTQGSEDPGSFHLLDAQNRLDFLGSAFPELHGKRLAKVSFTHIEGRDGRIIPMYITHRGDLTGPSPLIVVPHGGPWARDHGGWDEWAQLFAARGYMVAQPQFRGSKGFGRDLWLAGDREWGGRMQDDLDDTVKHFVASGAVDPKRVAMFGWSYGGYAALTAAWRGAGLYRCVIAGAAVSDLNRINAGLDGNFVLRRIQKPTIVGPSPVDRLAGASVPVLIIQGDIDRTVTPDHGRNAAAALQKAGKLHRYVEVKGLDHSLDKFSAEHKGQVYGEIDKWLSGPCGMTRAAMRAGSPGNASFPSLGAGAFTPAIRAEMSQLR
jgi:dipeptidyl aminopeptidase/acylaminoacyl peptidase